MIDLFDNRKGGRGWCEKCEEWHNNVSYHQAHECKGREDYTGKIPEEILQMAIKIEDWFIANKIKDWKLMNICSRGYINRLHLVQSQLEDIKNSINRITNYTQIWKCRRCNSIVDMANFRCQCTESPSPWEPIY